MLSFVSVLISTSLNSSEANELLSGYKLLFMVCISYPKKDICYFTIHISRSKYSCLHHLWKWNWQNVPKFQQIKFICWGITQKKEYNKKKIVVIFIIEFCLSSLKVCDKSVLLNWQHIGHCPASHLGYRNIFWNLVLSWVVR